MTTRNRAMIYILFTLSGFSGLIYEAIWARYLKLLLGHASYGQIMTICIYMGGLGIGSFIAGLILRHLKNIFRTYAFIELSISCGAFLYHPLYTGISKFLKHMVHEHESFQSIYTFLTIASCFIITFPLAVLLGMTFPILTAGLIRNEGIKKRIIAHLYFTNSIGAALGILCTSFIFIPLMGTEYTLYAAGILNALIGFYFLTYRNTTTFSGDEDQGYYPVSIHRARKCEPDNRFLITLAFATGFSSFLYEVGWIRLLSLLLGSFTHSFDLIISSFILGLSLGSLFISRFPLKKTYWQLLAWAQILMGICAVGTLICYKPFFYFFSFISANLRGMEGTYFFISFFKYFLSVLIICPASFFAGMTLPLITFALIQRTKDDRYTGVVYGWNTVGSILGVLSGGLFILPLMQLERIFHAGAIIDIIFGLIIIFTTRNSRKFRIAGICLSICAIISAVLFQFDDQLISSGVYRDTYYEDNMEHWVRDGKTATISVTKGENIIAIETNGKVDASIDTDSLFSGDNTTQAGLAFYSMALVNKPYNAAIIGLGSGMTAHYLLTDSLLTKLDVIEIEEEIYKMAIHFKPYNENIYNNKKFRIHFQDARRFFASKKKSYDIIISEPSNPWISGVSSLFTKEFYAQIKPVLKENGVILQWIHLYNFNTDLLMSIFRAIKENFQYFHVYSMDFNSDICIMISEKKIDLHSLDRMACTESIKTEYEKLGISFDTFSNRCFLLSHNSLNDIMKYYSINSDFYPIVDNFADQAFYRKEYVKLFDVFDGDISYYQELFEDTGFLEIIRKRSEMYGEYEYKIPFESMDYLIKKVYVDRFEIVDWSKFFKQFIELYPLKLWYSMIDSIPALDSLFLYFENVADPVPMKHIIMANYYTIREDKNKQKYFLKRVIQDGKPGLSYSVAKNLFIVSIKLSELNIAQTIYEKYLKPHVSKNEEEQHIIEELLLRCENRD